MARRGSSSAGPDENEVEEAAEAPVDRKALPPDKRRPEKAERPGRPRRRGTVALAAALVVAALAGGFGWWRHDEAHRRDVAVRQSTAAANAAAQAIFSYDYRSFDASVANGRAFATGAFADEYARTTAALKANAVSEQAIVRASVSATGVVSAAPGRVELLLYVDQYRRNANITGEKVDQNRVVLTMVPVGGAWKVSHAIAV